MARIYKVVALGHREVDKGGQRLVCNHDAFEGGTRRYLEPGVVTEVQNLSFLSDIRSGDVLPADEETAKRAGVKFDKAAVDKLVAEEAKKAASAAAVERKLLEPTAADKRLDHKGD